LTPLGPLHCTDLAGAPNWKVCNIFSLSVLIQSKIPLEGLSVLPIGTFLLKGLNSSFILGVRNHLHRIGGVQVHSTID
jgi:hypothetical protein